MTLVKLFESSHVAIGGFLRQLIICGLRCLGFGCGHVLGPLGQARNKSHKFRLVLARISRFREFQGSSTVSSECSRGDAVWRSVPSNAAVMRRFTRVVALPDPKNSDFPAESILFVRLGCRIRGEVWY